MKYQLKSFKIIIIEYLIEENLPNANRITVPINGVDTAWLIKDWARLHFGDSYVSSKK